MNKIVKAINFCFILYCLLSSEMINCARSKSLLKETQNYSGSISVNVTLNADIFKSALGSLTSSSAASATLQASASTKCVTKFYNFIKTLPFDVQDAIVSEFKKNTSANSCCTASSLIKAVSPLLNNNLRSFTNVMSSESEKSKTGLGCFRSPELIHKEIGMNVTTNLTGQNKDFIKEMLNTHHQVNADLAQCVVRLNKLRIKHLGLMCMDNDAVSKLFNFDADGNVSSPKKNPADLADISTDCTNYMKSYNTYSNTVLGGFIDNINYAIGSDQCDYFSNFFSFDINKDKNDKLFPSTANIYMTESSSELVKKYQSCASSQTSFNQTQVSELVSKVNYAQQTNPNGLATYIGRYDVNYDIIKDTFYLSEYPKFYVHCENKQCKALCSECNTLQWNSNNVTLTDTTELDVSCCDKVCIVHARILDTVNGEQMYIAGAETFYVNNDKYLRDFDDLLLAKARNANKCFDFNKTNVAAVNSTLSANTNTTASTNTTVNATTSSNSTNTTVSSNTTVNSNANATTASQNNLTDSALRAKLQGIIDRDAIYQNDYRFENVLDLYLNGSAHGNATAVKIKDYFYNELLKSNKTVYFACENGSCRVQCDDCGDKTFILQANNDYNTSSTNVVYKKSSPAMRTSGSISASAKFSIGGGSSLTSSSGSKTGSSLTSSSSSSTKTGSSLTSSSSSSAPSSSLKTGSSLTSSSSSSAPSSSYNSGSSSSTKTGSSLTSSSSSSAPSASYKNTGSSSTSTTTQTTTTHSSSSTSSNISSSSTFKFNLNIKIKTGSTVTSSSTNSAHYNYGSSSQSTKSSSLQSGATILGSSSSSYAKNTNSYSSSYGTNYFSTSPSKNSDVNSANSSSYNPNTYISHKNTVNYKINYQTTYNVYNSRSSSSSSSSRAYTYTPAYYDFNDYNAFSYHHSGFSRNLNIYNYNLNYYRPIYTSNIDFAESSVPYIKAEFDPSDWVPQIQPRFVIGQYMDKINSNINNLKIYIECCPTFCVTLVDTFKDGLSTGVYAKQRVFLDVVLRNFAFLNPTSLNRPQKKCVVSKFFSTYTAKPDYTILTTNSTTTTSTTNSTTILKDCHVSAPFDFIPVKDRCGAALTSTCNNANFQELVNKISAFIPSSSSDQQCGQIGACVNVTSSSNDADKQACGDSMYNLFMDNGIKINYNTVVSPCANKTITLASTTKALRTAMAEVGSHKMRTVHTALLQQQSNSTYADVNSLNSTQKSQYSNTSDSAQSAGSSSVTIDNSAPGKPATASDAELNSINSGPDAKLANSSGETLKRIGYLLLVSTLVILL